MPNRNSYFKDPRLLRLALKYSYVWKVQCEALRHKPASDPCSVHHVIIRAFDGSLQVLRREQLPRLKAGCLPFGAGRVEARVRELPGCLPPDLFFVPLDIALYLGSDAADFAALLFTAPTRVYLLLPSLMREPRWLRDLFVKVRDPASGNQVAIPTSWHFGSGFALLLAAGMKYQDFVGQRLMVWESVKVYDEHEEVVLGGPGLAEMGDTMFVIATRSLRGSAAAAAAAAASLHVGASRGSQAIIPTRGSLPTTLQLQLRSSGGDGGTDDGYVSGAECAPVSATSGRAARSFAALGDAAIGGGRVGSVAYNMPGRRFSLPVQFASEGAAGGRDQRPPPPQLFFRRTADGVVNGVVDGGAVGGGGAGGISNGGGGGPGSGGGSGPVPVSGAGWLLQRYFKAIKRDRLQDLRALLRSEPWQRYCMTPEELSFLPPGERHPLAVDLATKHMSVPLLVELVDGAGCHLNYCALKLLVAQWDRLPDLAPGGGEGLLLRYLVRHPNPLSVVGSFLLAMRGDLAGGGNHSAGLKTAVPRFAAVQLELLRQVQDSYFRISEDARMEAGLPLLEDILEQPQAMIATGGGGGGGGGAASSSHSPAAQPLVLSDYSPLRLAFRDHDTQFMSAQLIEAYTRRRWLGPEYTALTSLDGHRRLSGLDPLLVYTLVQNLGFVGDAGAASMQATFRLWHLITMTSPAFFRSPRGRWAIKFTSTFVHLVIFTAVLFAHEQLRLPASEGGGRWRGLATGFLVFTVGNLLEGAEVVAMRYGNSAGRYFLSAPGEVLGLLVDTGVFACLAPCVVAAYADDRAAAAAASEGLPAPPSQLDPGTWMSMRMALSTLGIFVWLRTLAIMIPLYRKLGPLIRTMYRMAGEILAFVPLYVIVTIGFAVAFHSTIGDQVPAYGTFVGTLLHLFEAALGTFYYDDLNDLDDNVRLYSQVLLTTYLVVTALLLTNLLIAIISYKYRPEEVRALSVFDLAEMVDRYRFQVKHHLICSPFNLLLLVFAWLPAADMPKLPPYEWVKYGLTPLDGLTFATPGYPTTPGGRDEIPHLCYLLTLYPLLMVAANVLYYLHAPYTVLYWAITGHRKLLKELLGDSHALRDNSGGGSNVSGGGGGGGGTAWPAAAASGGGAGGGPGDVASKASVYAGGGRSASVVFGASETAGRRWVKSHTRPQSAGETGESRRRASAGATPGAAAAPGLWQGYHLQQQQQQQRQQEPQQEQSEIEPPAARQSPLGEQTDQLETRLPGWDITKALQGAHRAQIPGANGPGGSPLGSQYADQPAAAARSAPQLRTSLRDGTFGYAPAPPASFGAGGATTSSVATSVVVVGGGGGGCVVAPSSPSTSVRSGDSRGSAAWVGLPLKGPSEEQTTTAAASLISRSGPIPPPAALSPAPSSAGLRPRAVLPRGCEPSLSLSSPPPPVLGRCAEPVAEAVEWAEGTVGGDGNGGGKDGGEEAAAAERQSPVVTRLRTAPQSGTGAEALRAKSFRVRSIRSMHSYATSRDGTGSGARTLGAHVEEANLYDDMSDSDAVQPPYMKLLRLATLSGLREAALSAALFVVLVVVGAVLYVVVMGLLAGTLACCVSVWVGSVVVSVIRIVVGAWRGAVSEEDSAGTSAQGVSAGPTGNVGSGAAAAAAPPYPPNNDGAAGTGLQAGSAQGRPGLITTARLARKRAKRSTYLARAQVEAAIRTVYSAANALSVWHTAAVAAGGTGPGGAGGAGGGSGSIWATTSSRLLLSPIAVHSTGTGTGTAAVPPAGQRVAVKGWKPARQGGKMSAVAAPAAGESSAAEGDDGGVSPVEAETPVAAVNPDVAADLVGPFQTAAAIVAAATEVQEELLKLGSSRDGSRLRLGGVSQRQQGVSLAMEAAAGAASERVSSSSLSSGPLPHVVPAAAVAEAVIAVDASAADITVGVSKARTTAAEPQALLVSDPNDGTQRNDGVGVGVGVRSNKLTAARGSTEPGMRAGAGAAGGTAGGRPRLVSQVFGAAPAVVGDVHPGSVRVVLPQFTQACRVLSCTRRSDTAVPVLYGNVSSDSLGSDGGDASGLVPAVAPPLQSPAPHQRPAVVHGNFGRSSRSALFAVAAAGTGGARTVTAATAVAAAAAEYDILMPCSAVNIPGSVDSVSGPLERQGVATGQRGPSMASAAATSASPAGVVSESLRDQITELQAQVSQLTSLVRQLTAAKTAPSAGGAVLPPR